MNTIPLYDSSHWDSEKYPYINDDFDSAKSLAFRSRLGGERCKDGAMKVHGNQIISWQYNNNSILIILWESGKIIKQETIFDKFTELSMCNHTTIEEFQIPQFVNS